jgi:hypothetical protein
MSADFTAHLRAPYGDRIERLVLFGSRAHGARGFRLGHRGVFRGSERSLARAPPARAFQNQHSGRDERVPGGTAAPRAGSYRERTSLMHEIRRDRLDL